MAMPKEFEDILSLAKTKEDMEKLLAWSFSMARKGSETNLKNGNPQQDERNELEERVNLLLNRQEEDIEVGDWVTWKRGLHNRKQPQPGQVAKVIELLSTPLINNKEDSGSPYFGEKLDLVLAFVLVSLLEAVAYW